MSVSLLQFLTANLRDRRRWRFHAVTFSSMHCLVSLTRWLKTAHHVDLQTAHFAASAVGYVQAELHRRTYGILFVAITACLL